MTQKQSTIHLAGNIISACGITNTHTSTNPRKVTCSICLSDNLEHERINDARIYCTCNPDFTELTNRRLDQICPIHRVTLQQAIEHNEIPLPQNERRSRPPNSNISFGERRQVTRRTFDRELMPVYQDPLEMLWVAQIETMKGDFQAMAIIEAATEKEAIAKIEKELTDFGVDYQGFFVTQLSGINFNECNGVYKI